MLIQNIEFIFFSLTKLMPYGRTYKYRRYRRYNNRKLSNRNIYSHKSATSQAVQIAALRNKINKVYKAAKPETKCKLENSAGQYAMDSSVAGNTYLTMGTLPILSGTGDDQRVGDKIYRRDTYYLTFEYFNNSTTGYHNGESSGTPVRLICGCWKIPKPYGTVPTLSSIISGYSDTGAPSTISAVAPLLNGVTETQYIYSDKTFYLTSERNQKVVKVKTPWYNCRYNSDSEHNHSWLAIKATGLHWDTDFTETIQVTYFRKTVFKDA